VMFIYSFVSSVTPQVFDKQKTIFGSQPGA